MKEQPGSSTVFQCSKCNGCFLMSMTRLYIPRVLQYFFRGENPKRNITDENSTMKLSHSGLLLVGMSFI